MMKYTVFNVKTLNLDAVQMMRLQLEVLILKVMKRVQLGYTFRKKNTQNKILLEFFNIKKNTTFRTLCF